MEELNTFLLTLILLILIYCMFKVKKETDETVEKFKPMGSYVKGTKVHLSSQQQGMGAEWKPSVYTNKRIVRPGLYKVNQQKRRKSNGRKKKCVCDNGTPVSNFRCPGKGLQECNQCKPNYRLAKVCVQNPPQKLY